MPVTSDRDRIFYRAPRPTPLEGLGREELGDGGALPEHRQNAVGDVVIPVERGEIVALPRLWDFDLAITAPDRALLVTAGGLRATIAFTEDTAVVESVADGGPRTLEAA
jgi:hypothetical protein